MKKVGTTKSKTPSQLIDARIKELGDWRGDMLARIRALVKEADAEVVEEWKWRGVPVWSHDGIICTGETYKSVVKMTFAKGASLDDPAGLFNSSLEGNTRRAIDFHEGDKINAKALKALIRAAAALNTSSATKKKTAKAKPRKDAKPALLSGGNPQIAKGDGDAPVKAYIAAMPGWKSDFGRRLDKIIVGAVPKVRKAVKWNSPFYGVEGKGWFLSYHCFAKYIKIAFFRGTSLRPLPPEESKDKEVRYLHIYEGEFDEAQFTKWVKQASKLQGWEP